MQRCYLCFFMECDIRHFLSLKMRNTSFVQLVNAFELNANTIKYLFIPL